MYQLEKIGIILLKKILLQVSFMRIFLILVFTLFPSVVFSKIGDVYYCSTEILIEIRNGKLTTYKNQKFKFKRTVEGLIFGNEDNYLQNMKMTDKNNDLGSELFSYGDGRVGMNNKIFTYEKGIFHLSHITYSKITSMYGRCSTF